jgi:hypothetical protein
VRGGWRSGASEASLLPSGSGDRALCPIGPFSHALAQPAKPAQKSQRDQGLNPCAGTKLTLSPARITEADAAAVYEAGWGDDALYSTVLVTALFKFYNRLVDGVGLALPDGYVAEAAKRLSTQGYDLFAQLPQA